MVFRQEIKPFIKLFVQWHILCVCNILKFSSLPPVATKIILNLFNPHTNIHYDITNLIFLLKYLLNEHESD